MNPWLAFALGLGLGWLAWEWLGAIIRVFQDWGRSHE